MWTTMGSAQVDSGPGMLDSRPCWNSCSRASLFVLPVKTSSFLFILGSHTVLSFIIVLAPRVVAFVANLRQTSAGKHLIGVDFLCCLKLYSQCYFQGSEVAGVCIGLASTLRVPQTPFNPGREEVKFTYCLAEFIKTCKLGMFAWVHQNL